MFGVSKSRCYTAAQTSIAECADLAPQHRLAQHKPRAKQRFMPGLLISEQKDIADERRFDLGGG